MAGIGGEIRASFSRQALPAPIHSGRIRGPRRSEKGTEREMAFVGGNLMRKRTLAFCVVPLLSSWNAGAQAPWPAPPTISNAEAAERAPECLVDDAFGTKIYQELTASLRRN